jgi:thiol-disulfide isomerase/thioredoxin
MQTTFSILAGMILATSASAEFREWTRNDGKSAELELLAVGDKDGEKAGQFKTRKGDKVIIPASLLTEADAKALAEWTPPIPAGPSVFDEFLKDSLLQLEKDQLRPVTNFKKPSKYYVFYYTASWCGPCKLFTPTLVTFYENHKSAAKADDFEIILVSLDQDAEAMRKYAAGSKMPWPHLKLSKTSDMKKQFKHPGRGIPNLVLCDLEGNIIKSSYENDKYIGPTAVMNHLGSLLSQ